MSIAIQKIHEKNQPKVMLTLDGSAISVKRFSWLSGEYIGCLALRTDGSYVAFSEKASPTEAEYYGLDDMPQSLSFDEKKIFVMEAIGISDEDEIPWLADDNDRASFSLERERLLLDEWLNREIPITDDRLYVWGERTASQYAVGFKIVKALKESDRIALGLREIDLGGPASSVPAVAMKATIEEFNRTMQANELPYLLIDDEGPLEVSSSETGAGSDG